MWLEYQWKLRNDMGNPTMNPFNMVNFLKITSEKAYSILIL